MADQLVRRVNLLAMLEEDEPDVPVPPECAAEDWSEAEIRTYYESGGRDVPAAKPKAVLPTTMQAMVAKERGTSLVRRCGQGTWTWMPWIRTRQCCVCVAWGRGGTCANWPLGDVACVPWVVVHRGGIGWRQLRSLRGRIGPLEHPPSAEVGFRSA